MSVVLNILFHVQIKCICYIFGNIKKHKFVVLNTNQMCKNIQNDEYTHGLIDWISGWAIIYLKFSDN